MRNLRSARWKINKLRLGLFSFLSLLLACDRPVESALNASAPQWSEEKDLAMQKLRQYCAACHGLGNLRFIYSSDNRQMWQDLFARTAPVSGKTWAEGIIEVLSWPGDRPPPVTDWLEYPTRDWMPKGLARLQLAEDVHGNQPVRQFMIEQLQTPHFSRTVISDRL